MKHLKRFRKKVVKTRQTKLDRFLSIIAYVCTFFYLFEYIFPLSWLGFVYSLLASGLFIYALFHITMLNRIVALTLIIVGTMIFYIEGVALYQVVLGFGENINLLALFLFIPLIGTFLSSAGYLNALQYAIQKRARNGQNHPYKMGFLLLATTGTVLNFGAMSIVKRIADESFTSFHERKLTLHIMRAFGFCMLWSPYFVNVGLVTVLFDVSWFQIGLYGFILALIHGTLSTLMLSRISFDNDPFIEREAQAEDEVESYSLRPLILFTMVLLTLSILLDYWLEMNMITIVSFLAIALPLLWALYSNILKQYVQDVSSHIQSAFPKVKNVLAIFISAGYFGTAINNTNMGEWVSTFLDRVSLGSVYFLTLLIIIVSILLAQLGIHPIVIVIGIGSSLSPVTLGVSPEYLALTLLLAWSLATQVSPFSGQVLMASRLINISTFKIAKQNAMFVLLSMIFLSLTLYSFFVLGWI
ncbi:TRAP transporter large permease subunit [Texcoconibacillus texcoconensis]|uniref:TRAP C4-dicarboxylate transport system permease DctM subunit domain-containing protein n=1 Tax=Texcoconibacillus texcoconensis TaxID=1095777 RepID=A0A840QS90_9BACI|nr:TRAP transporter large permease subunit [Texcoconibacillus texcoconensis]MBB5174376.1 hypothetical protein [Texcoconibacillus texcoconensis]